LTIISLQKIYFQPEVNLDRRSRRSSRTNAIRALLPPGIEPPIVLQYNASSIPVLQISPAPTLSTSSSFMITGSTI